MVFQTPQLHKERVHAILLAFDDQRSQDYGMVGRLPHCQSKTNTKFVYETQIPRVKTKTH